MSGRAAVRPCAPRCRCWPPGPAGSAAGGGAGVVGPVPARWHDELLAAAGRVEFLDQDYTQLRLVKSAAEIGWLRAGARLTDAGVSALAAGARPGMTEAALGALVESGYVAAGGQTHIRYLGVTPMDQPELCVPAQWPSSRPLRTGDVLSCEISASYGGYPGQLLRTFAVGAPPTPRYRDLHQVAEQAFDAMTARLRAGATAADLIEAASLITAAGFTVYDDLVHGYGGGYLPPVLTRAALERQQAPGLQVPGRDDRGHPAERDHYRRAGRGADRGTGPGDRGRLGVTAPVPAGFRPTRLTPPG